MTRKITQTPSECSYMLHSLSLVVLVSLADAIAGGGISIYFRLDGQWLPIEQGANRLYQAGIGMLTLLTLLYQVRALGWYVLGSMALLLGYLNDLLYYLFLPIVAPAHNFFLGADMGAREIHFPESIAGIYGWLASLIGAEFSMPLPCAILFALLSIGIHVSVYLRLLLTINAQLANTQNLEKGST